MNFLVTGADNSTDKSCIELQDKGPRTGERSDTIMIIRLDPATKRSAVLSFPRDLWVKIPGHGTQRINGAYRSDDPQLLIDTIQNEFDVHVDHFIQIDFCAFQRLVKAVGGVSVPLPYPVRDDSTGLEVLQPGCHSFDGDEALKYVRSRHFEYMDEKGEWHEDPSSDLGRIARQQDFLRRTLTAALKQNVLKPKIITSLYASYRDDLVIDTGLTIDKMIEFVGVIRGVNASTIRTYQIEATGKTIGGASVLVWHKNSENMQAILNIFRGLAPLADAPEQEFEDTTTTSTIPHTTTDRRLVDADRRDGCTTGQRRHHCTAHGRHRSVVERTRDRDRPGRERRVLISVRAPRQSLRRLETARRRSRSALPHSFANLTASSQSCSGATITNSGSAAAAACTSPSTVDRQSLSRIAILRAALLRLSCSPAARKAPAQIGGAVPAQRQHVGDHALARLVGRLALHRDDVLAERDHAVAVGAAQRDRGSRDRRGRQRLATHRPAAIDDEAQRGVGRAPRPDAQPLGIDGDTPGGRLDDRVEAGVEVEVAAVGPVGLLGDLADAAPRRRPSTSQIQEQARRQPPGELAQALIGRRGKLGEQRRASRRRRRPEPPRPRPRRARRPRARSARTAGCGRARAATWCGGATRRSPRRLRRLPGLAGVGAPPRPGPSLFPRRPAPARRTPRTTAR